jgi:hypothetical protein
MEWGSDRTERIIEHLTFKSEAEMKPKRGSRADLGICVPD